MVVIWKCVWKVNLDVIRLTFYNLLRFSKKIYIQLKNHRYIYKIQQIFEIFDKIKIYNMSSQILLHFCFSVFSQITFQDSEMLGISLNYFFFRNGLLILYPEQI